MHLPKNKKDGVPCKSAQPNSTMRPVNITAHQFMRAPSVRHEITDRGPKSTGRTERLNLKRRLNTTTCCNQPPAGESGREKWRRGRAPPPPPPRRVPASRPSPPPPSESCPPCRERTAWRASVRRSNVRCHPPPPLDGRGPPPPAASHLPPSLEVAARELPLAYPCSRFAGQIRRCGS
jgi:hypothetical protein